jgi:catechol 2,3-dioxygenase-like lactoylglutathione lyase family enzyme
MKRTVDFYTKVLGMPLIKTVELPGGGGQHFFFEAGKGQSLAFFWFPGAPKAAPGVASPREVVGLGKDPDRMEDFTTAHASMNHVAFDVPREKLEEYRAKLEAKGVPCSIIFDHDDSPIGMGPKGDATTWIRSIYFSDPDGIMLEFAAWTRQIGQEGDVRHEPKTAADATG